METLSYLPISFGAGGRLGFREIWIQGLAAALAGAAAARATAAGSIDAQIELAGTAAAHATARGSMAVLVSGRRFMIAAPGRIWSAAARGRTWTVAT